MHDALSVDVAGAILFVFEICIRKSISDRTICRWIQRIRITNHFIAHELYYFATRDAARYVAHVDDSQFRLFIENLIRHKWYQGLQKHANKIDLEAK